MAASVDFKTYVDQACRAADEFVNIYYETMDKRRRALTRLYLDKATLVWNGNAVSGQEELNKFFEMLPSSEFQVNVLDCQPVHGLSSDCCRVVLGHCRTDWQLSLRVKCVWNNPMANALPKALSSSKC
ncbi:NTF2-related export protein 2 isoform X3 [Vidua chalybeata]|uniref:NTF2-related export protein 2 isoform X3 n=1 Tax=Vidua chalybeata TaxID=81927 RepID=UPI0023A7D064|nr:NTF2-related export protein 2 isoform X3 [Vidua chalybeata]